MFSSLFSLTRSAFYTFLPNLFKLQIIFGLLILWHLNDNPPVVVACNLASVECFFGVDYGDKRNSFFFCQSTTSLYINLLAITEEGSNWRVSKFGNRKYVSGVLV